jgi:hypothetical protein
MHDCRPRLCSCARGDVAVRKRVQIAEIVSGTSASDAKAGGKLR